MDEAPVENVPPAQRRGRYGIDAPYVPAMLGLIGLVLLVAGIALCLTVTSWGVALVVVGAFQLSSAGIYLYTTLRGKFAVWGELLDGMALRGDERVLDIGCGRGAVLMQVARRLRDGRAVGLDLWRGVDQSGNALDATARNAAAEGVSDRVELATGDMTAMPFPDGEFDVVVSSLAIHNIPSEQGRLTALDEALRVLRPGGRLALVDMRYVPDYERRLADRGVTALSRRGLGPRFWFGGPWTGATLVTGTRSPEPHRPAAP